MATSIEGFTTHHLITVQWDESLFNAYHLMHEKEVRHLPVTGPQGTIIGIISERDFLRGMQIDQPDFESGYVAQPKFDPNSRVRDFMSWPVEVIDASHSLSDAARLMLDKKISALLVTEGTKAVGIVTTDDLLRALLLNVENPVKSVTDQMRAALYNSPIGQIAHQLAQAGV